MQCCRDMGVARSRAIVVVGQRVCGIGIQKRKVVLYYCPHKLVFHCFYGFEPSSLRPAAFLDAIDSNNISNSV